MTKKQTYVPLMAVLAVVAGCGSSTATRSAHVRETTTPVPPVVKPFKSTVPHKASGEVKIPSRGKLEKALKHAGPAAFVRRAKAQDRELAAQRARQIPVSSTTAPAAVLELATKSARAWLAYRVDGTAPPTELVPAALTATVPPMAPSLRLKGHARLSDMHAYSAHPDKHGVWIVLVSTDDNRAKVIVVQVSGTATHPVTAGLSEQS